MYRMNGRMAMSGDLLGALVSDLTPKSIVDSRIQEETELRVRIQQQLAALLKRRLNVALFFQDQNNLTTAPQNRCYTATSQKSKELPQQEGFVTPKPSGGDAFCLTPLVGVSW